MHDDDCADGESPAARIDAFERGIFVTIELDEYQLARLKEIADRCPVHTMLLGEKQFMMARITID